VAQSEAVADAVRALRDNVQDEENTAQALETEARSGSGDQAVTLRYLRQRVPQSGELETTQGKYT